MGYNYNTRPKQVDVFNEDGYNEVLSKAVKKHNMFLFILIPKEFKISQVLESNFQWMSLSFEAITQKSAETS